MTPQSRFRVSTWPVVMVAVFICLPAAVAILTINGSRIALANGVLAVMCAAMVMALSAVHIRRLRRLEQSEALITSLLNAVPESMMLLDPCGMILAMNETAARRLGAAPDLMLGGPIWDHIPADVAGRRRERLAEALATKRTVVFEDQRDGYCFQHVVTPIIDPDMEVRRVAALAFDITEFRRIQAALEESEETFRRIFYEAPDPILLIDESNCFADCNQAAVSMLGAEFREQVLTRHPSHFSPEFQPDGQLSARKADSIIQAVFAQQDMHFEWLHQRLDGTEFYVEVSLNPISLQGRKMQLVHWRDITERKRIESALGKLSTAVEQSPVAIVITDSAGAIEYANPKFYRMTGYTAEETLGQNPRILKAGTQPPELYRELWETITAGREWQGEFHNRSREGRLFWENASISPIRNVSGVITHFVAVKEDITERKLLQEQLAHMAHFDSLTGLPNRALFFDRAGQAVAFARREKRRCGILFVDLDGFKNVNDTHGHETGDRLLCLAAERIRSSLRESDTVARMGGDEFTVILTTLRERNDAALVADKILGRLVQPFVIGDAVCHIGASIGISIFPDDADDAEKLLHGADSAMYDVKRSGKGTYRFFLADRGSRYGRKDEGEERRATC
ncbi:MAG TPA: PAS domain S-box protein [Desulfuromonadaceae bacterium]